MLNKSIGNNQIAVVLELIVHIHSSRKSVDLTRTAVLPEAHIIGMSARAVVLCHPAVPAADT